MSYPDVYMFKVTSGYSIRIIAILAMSEESALEAIENEYSDSTIELIESVSIMVLDTPKEIFEIDFRN